MISNERRRESLRKLAKYDGPDEPVATQDRHLAEAVVDYFAGAIAPGASAAEVAAAQSVAVALTESQVWVNHKMPARLKESLMKVLARDVLQIRVGQH